MPLSTGSRLGSYEIISAIGAGGMGEVYRARDTKLNRDVAIKVLPGIFASDPERLARFERGAQLLASLNHPHIAQIYGVEAQGAAHALVMEFVDGEDLAERISRGALPVEEALRIAREIADAVEAAHERGIIHRDLKPANIKVRDDGAVKVLDFGLGKAIEASSTSGPYLMNSPTLTSPARLRDGYGEAGTVAGMVIGTAAYMAPEQAKGRAADKRADIWAFGVVLYEMLTGGRLFDGETIIETMGLVATRDVDLAKLPASTPRRVRDLLQRCLERDPKARLRDLGEARIAIDRTIAGPADAPPAPVAAPRSAWRWLSLAAVAVLTAAASIAGTWWWVTSRAPAIPHRRFVLAAPAAMGGSGAGEFAIAPDGRKVAFVANRRLHIWELDQLRPRELKSAGETGAGEASPSPFWSPDSEFVGYSAGGRLWRISTRDGEPVAICNLPGAINGGAWQADGAIAFSTTRGPMYQVAAAGGEPKVLIPLAEGEVDFHDPAVLPDGRGLVYSVHGPTGTDTIEVFSGSARKVILRMGGKTRVTPQVFNVPVYSPTGHILYRLDEGNVGVWAVPFALSKLETTGEPFLVASGARQPSVASDGTLVYAPTADAAPGQLVWLRADGTVEQAVGETKQGIASAAISPDGARIAYTAIENNNSDVWVVSAAGSTRITATPGNETRPQWMTDGLTLVFSCPTEQGGAVCATAADGSGQTRVLIRNASTVRFAPDGRVAVYQTVGTAERGLKVFDVQSGESRPYVLSPFELLPMGFSANGRYCAYTSFQSGNPRIYIRQFPSGEGQWEVPGVRSGRISWPRGGRELFAIVGSARELPVVAVPIETGAATPVFGAPRAVFTALQDRFSLLDGFAASADGKRFLTIQRQQSESQVSGIVVVQNWLAEFRKP